ncbi:MAG: SDR family oxidoreductase [Cyanobacteriota bacterium]|nr:SDR family oxidoreductase [Cyanobacteriota bacterium]
MNLNSKVAIVTGGGSGIGRATAIAFAKAGASVVIANRNVERGEEVVQFIGSTGGKAIFQKTDVARSSDVEALVNRTVQEFGRLDIAFNNAGIDGSHLPLAEQSETDVTNLLDVNVKGVWLCMKYQVAQMLQNGGGAIVNNSSIFGLNGYPTWSVYTATKHAVTGMTKAAALEYAQQGIRINAVAPGPIETPLLEVGTGGDPHSYSGFVPMGRIGQPEEVANAVVWLCSDAASFVTGHTLPVDGGVCAQ